jgi:hypothetical protein
MVDIGDRRLATVLRFLAVQPSEALDFFHGKLSLGIERCYLIALLAKLGGELLSRLTIETGVNEPG